MMILYEKTFRCRCRKILHRHVLGKETTRRKSIYIYIYIYVRQFQIMRNNVSMSFVFYSPMNTRTKIKLTI
jgi:hypothetical protein